MESSGEGCSNLTRLNPTFSCTACCGAWCVCFPFGTLCTSWWSLCCSKKLAGGCPPGPSDKGTVFWLGSSGSPSEGGRSLILPALRATPSRGTPKTQSYSEQPRASQSQSELLRTMLLALRAAPKTPANGRSQVSRQHPTPRLYVIRRLQVGEHALFSKKSTSVLSSGRPLSPICFKLCDNSDTIVCLQESDKALAETLRASESEPDASPCLPGCVQVLSEVPARQRHVLPLWLGGRLLASSSSIEQLCGSSARLRIGAVGGATAAIALADQSCSLRLLPLRRQWNASLEAFPQARTWSVKTVKRQLKARDPLGEFFVVSGQTVFSDLLSEATCLGVELVPKTGPLVVQGGERPAPR